MEGGIEGTKPQSWTSESSAMTEPPRCRSSVEDFEEDLIAYLSKFTASLESQATRVFSKLDALEGAVSRAERGLDRIDGMLTTSHAAGKVVVASLDVSTLVHTKSLGTSRLQDAASAHLSHGQRHASLGDQDARVLPGPQAQALDAISLGIYGMKQFAKSHEGNTLSLPNVLFQRKHSSPAGSFFGKHAAPTSQQSESHSIPDMVRQGPDEPESNLAQQSKGVDVSRLMLQDDDAHFWHGPENSSSSSSSSSRRAQGGLEGSLQGNAAGNEEDGQPSTREEWASDSLEASATAVRGFRALLDAALRAPGAFGEHTVWAPPPEEEHDELHSEESEGGFADMHSKGFDEYVDENLADGYEASNFAENRRTLGSNNGAREGREGSEDTNLPLQHKEEVRSNSKNSKYLSRVDFLDDGLPDVDLSDLTVRD